MNPPKVYDGVPPDVVIPAKEAALIQICKDLLAEGVVLLKTRCGDNPTTSASMAIIKELDNKFDKIRDGIGDPTISPVAFEVYLVAVQPEVGAAYYLEKTKRCSTNR